MWLYMEKIIIIWWFKTTLKYAGVKVLKGGRKGEECSPHDDENYRLARRGRCMDSARREEFFSHLLMTSPTATRLRLTIIIQLWRVTCTSSGVYRDRDGAVISFSCTRPCKTAIGIKREREERESSAISWIASSPYKLQNRISKNSNNSVTVVFTGADWGIMPLNRDYSGKSSKSSLLRVQ